MKPARVVAIMPVYNEARHLRRVLESIRKQDFDRERLYVVAVDGGSTDGSVRIVEQWLDAAGIEGSIAVNPRRKIPISLNVGLRYATDEDIVVRLDAHTLYGPGYLSRIVGALEGSPHDVGCIGAAHVPIPGTTFSQKMVESLYTNPMGLGGADYRLGGDVRECDNVYLGAWRPGLLARAGYFNEALEANEDGEMSARIRQLGYRILRAPLPCRFIINRGLWGSVRQWHRYGYWRCKMLRSNPSFIRRRHLINPAAAFAVVAIALSPARMLLLPLFGAYAALVLYNRARGEHFAVTLGTMVFFPILQFAYAAGMFKGLLSSKGRSSRSCELRRAVRTDSFVE